MYELKVIDTFEAAHRLSGGTEPCQRVHGHNWKVEVVCKGKTLNEDSMVIDFIDIKRFLREILDPFDHRMLNEVTALEGIEPTAENLSKFIFDGLQNRIKVPGVSVDSVAIWENEQYCSTYRA